jgi:invasion protein IalB
VVALFVICLGVGAANYFDIFSLSDTSDAATPVTAVPKVPAPAPSQEGAQGQQAAQPKVSNQKNYGDWLYSCLTFADNKVQCSVVQTLSDNKSKQPVFQWRIVQNGNGGLVGIWQTPTGVMVNRGIVLEVGTPKPIAIPYEYCGQGGCEATGNLAPDFLATLAKAQKASATIFARGEKGITFPISVKGLSEALAALK